MRKYSVIIPVYNAEKSIIKVLDSVVSQSITPFEIIIIDDGSIDNTVNLIKTFLQSKDKININLIINNTNKGVSFSRNLGLKQANGDYIAFLDSDDCWHSQKIEIIDKIIEITNADLLGHKYTLYNNLQDFLKFDKSKIVQISIYRLLIRNIFQTSCVVLKNSSLYYFDEKMSYSEDYDLFLKITLDIKKVFFYNENLTLLGRPQLSKGGLSEKKMKMRIGEILAVSRTLKKLNLILLIPFYLVYSMIKYVLKIFR